MEHFITSEEWGAFTRHLQEEERSAGTIEKYQRDVRALAEWLRGGAVT